MNLRVISGSAKGRKLRSVPGASTRPVTDWVKEALFDIIAGDVLDSTWFDLFAGTGAIGIEALSRGAAFVRFVDNNRQAIETIRWNLEHCRLVINAEILRMDAFSLLPGRADRPFDYVYIAPPQYHDLWSRALLSLDENASWLSPDAWVIIQIHPKEYHDMELKNLVSIDERKYGNTLLVFLERSR